MDPRPIGVFDSGIGGLSAVRALRRLLPEEPILYLGDTARMPYGCRPADEIDAFTGQITAWLLRRGVCRRARPFGHPDRLRRRNRSRRGRRTGTSPPAVRGRLPGRGVLVYRRPAAGCPADGRPPAGTGYRLPPLAAAPCRTDRR